MKVFNSLGSNYDFLFVLRSLFASNIGSKSSKLKDYLDQKYQGQSILVYKGREALKLALDLSGLPPNSQVAINGYTCFAVYQSVVDAGCAPVFLDISESDFNFSAQTLLEKLKSNPGIKAVIIQNTLGLACDIEAIETICKKENITLIEDLAHSVGVVYKNGKMAGTVGDFVVLSFSQDKIIDAVSGGALVVRNQKYQRLDAKLIFSNVDSVQKLRDRFYPFWTFVIRKTYSIGIGRFVHKFLKIGKILSTPMGNRAKVTLHKLPGSYAGLALAQFAELENNLKHRKAVAEIYSQVLGIPLDHTSTYLRFILLNEKRNELINYLKKRGIYISDIWYDAPIAPKSYMAFVNHPCQCPNAEKVSSLILNLPTHRNISLEYARKIAETVKQWQSKQK